MNKEEAIHKSICEYIRVKYPDVIFTSDGSGVVMHKFTAFKFAKLKSSRGIPDLLILEPKANFCGLLLEIKADSPFKKDGTIRKSRHLHEQAHLLDRLKHKGYATYFVVGVNQACDIIDQYMTQ